MSLKKSFDRIIEKVDEKQRTILQKTDDWRKEMIRKFTFTKGDFTIEFNQNLLQELQNMFYDYGLKINVDASYLTERIQEVLEGSNIALNASSLNIDAASLAALVVDDMRGPVAAMTGVTSGATAENTDRAAAEMESALRHLDIAEDYVRDVVEKIKAVANYAVRPEEKDTDSTKATRAKFDAMGIDLAKIKGATSDEAIASILENSLLKRGGVDSKLGLSTIAGSARVDELMNFKDSSSKTIPAFAASLQELFYMLQLDTQSVEEITRKRNSMSIFNYARDRAVASRGVKFY